MNIIYDWIKDIIFYLILISLVFQLLPNDQYRKYMKLFAGILLVIIVLKPLKVLLREESLDQVRAAFHQYDNYEEDVQLQIEEFKKKQEEIYSEYAQGELKAQIQKLIEKKGFIVQKAEVKNINENEKLCISLVKENTGVKNIIVEAVQIEKEPINKESKEIIEIKKKIADYYKISDSNIQIQLGGK
ncbi:stage III sporulation protein AF [Anaerosacchariphilus polymeriproducens]|uniref:Stage III sporulation protein AF n=1 Tax=Anaerosacchariphilus polymeriproducens TaxID=1812858 RepID=A0A371AXY0_9FIRM|nr:stage III sporulation protein AF [Anaerosacchariphilus polymeriproducens]RDU24350.1 hypothetical protein DWV06_05085 [Anaerosacchariphilus polymeriproducens]